MTYTVPSKKIIKHLEFLKNILIKNVLALKQLAKITGKLSPMHLAIGSLGLFYEEYIPLNRKQNSLV